MKKEFKGIIPILQTPFMSDGKVDYEKVKDIVEFCISSGAHGVGTGFGSEFYALSDEERKKLTEKIVDAVNGRVPVIVAGGHSSAEVAKDVCKHAEDAGADGLLVVPPYVAPSTLEFIKRYYSLIASSVNIPIIVQDAPSASKVTLPSTFIVGLAREYSSIKYVKVETNPSLQKISELYSLSNSKLILFGGMGGRMMIEEYFRGAKGNMPGCALVDLFVRVFNYLEEGKVRDAMDTFYTRLLPILNYESQEGYFLSCEKYLLMVRGVTSSTVTRTMTPLDEKSKIEFDRLIRYVGLCNI
jgi:4-hydroxy-tetrahydrodipicolinate synthase